MYTEFYNLKEKPFSLSPDPSYLYLSKQHQTALTMLNYGIQSQAGVTVITGEVGCGKTTLTREILHNMEEDVTVGLISNAHGSFGDLLQWVMLAFDLKTENNDKAVRYQLFTEFLIKEYSENKRTVLIIDEAQNLEIETLEELRLLTNINADKHLVLQLILIGQPELLEIMQRHELRQLAQRVSVDYKLKALGYKETTAYIRHRLTIAGGKNLIFDKYAAAVVYYHSSGIPRLINTLCDYALVYGYAEEAPQIDLTLMLNVIKDKQQGGIFPKTTNENREQAKIRQLIQEQKGIDVVPDLSEDEEPTIFQL
ncbi:MAG: AAA family ATPase [Methylococcaceae bacterium]|nr:AAA family ATPase [Methylococcaceae bacterium]